MRVISVNVGMPQERTWKGKTITTGIFKDPVAGRIQVRRLNLEGDGQADLKVHGGITKAVYAYPAEHYPYWSERLDGRELPWGMFGENLTTEGLREESIRIGDRFRVGTVELRVTEPRMPCSKLGLRFERPDILKMFLDSGRTGFYFAVEREGEVEAGDRIEPIGAETHDVTILDVTRGYSAKRNDPAHLERVAAVESLPDSWRGWFRHRMEKIRKE